MTTTPRGRVVWYENLATDTKKAEAFYTKLFGWGTESMDNGGQPYTMWTGAAGPFGGLMTLPPEAAAHGAPSNWLMYVGTPDLDAAVKQAAKLGGKAMSPRIDVPEMGSLNVMADPQGAVFALWQSAAGQPDDVTPPAVGGVAWHELATTDYVAAWSFYSTMFGWEKRDAMDMGPVGIYQMWSRPGWPFPVGAVFNKPPEIPVPCWCLYFEVADLDASVAQVTKLGGQVINGPMDVPGGRIAQCLDPNGALFAVHETKGA